MRLEAAESVGASQAVNSIELPLLGERPRSREAADEKHRTLPIHSNSQHMSSHAYEKVIFKTEEQKPSGISSIAVIPWTLHSPALPKTNFTEILRNHQPGYTNSWGTDQS